MWFMIPDFPKEQIDNAGDIGFVTGVLIGLQLSANLLACHQEGVEKALAAMERIQKRNQQQIENYVPKNVL